MKIKIGIDFNWSRCYYEGDLPDLEVIGVVTMKPHSRPQLAALGYTEPHINGNVRHTDKIVEVDV